MKLFVRKFFVSLWLIILSTSCFDPPMYSVIPEIEFQNIVFKDAANPYTVDSLQVTIGFKDGDGDLGLSSSDTTTPYNEKMYFYLPNGSRVNYKTKRTNPDYDTLPAFVKPHYCLNWEVINLNQKVDTFYFKLNPNQYNIFVDFFIKNPDGAYTKFDWQKEFANYPSCGETFHGRFPILNIDKAIKKPINGSIKYSMNSVGFLSLYSIKTLKLRITIQDRTLHKSNTVETGDFTLQQIKKSE